MSSVKDVISQFIKDNFITGRSTVLLDGSLSLIDSGIMDSTGVLELVEFLEATYAITIEDEDLVPENLETIDNMVAFLKTKGIT
ncbi:MAG TPA: acyl carrier protein [Deltaproteobacteria bacterium]|nr:acyl carrier protein [Deltaproteobacteria bacterium]